MMEFQSDLSLIVQFISKTLNTTHSTFHSTVRFLISSSSKVCNKRNCKEGRFIKYSTARRAIQLPQVVKGLSAGDFLGGTDPTRGS